MVLKFKKNRGLFERKLSSSDLLNDFLLNYLEQEIDEDVFNAVNAVKAPNYKITDVFISDSIDNPCLCINFNEEFEDFICNRFNISESHFGDGVDGFINIQYPISNESQTYIAGDHWEEDVKNLIDDVLIHELLSILIEESRGRVSRRNFELKNLFGTSDITEHDNMIMHGYTNGLSLVLLENNNTNEAYVTFECSSHNYAEWFPTPFKTFDCLEEAESYIQKHIDTSRNKI